jgi:hypothetical protein
VSATNIGDIVHEPKRTGVTINRKEEGIGWNRCVRSTKHLDVLAWFTYFGGCIYLNFIEPNLRHSCCLHGTECSSDEA